MRASPGQGSRAEGSEPRPVRPSKDGTDLRRLSAQRAEPGSPRSRPAGEPVLLESHLGKVPPPRRSAKGDPRAVGGVEVAGSERGDPIAHVYEESALAVERGQGFFEPELVGDPALH